MYDSEVISIILVVLDRSKLGGYKWSVKVFYGWKFDGRSLVEFREVKVVSEVFPCDGMSDERDFCNIVVGSWTIKTDVYLLGESLGAESLVRGGSYVDI